MSTWRNAITTKPVINNTDKWDNEHKVSKRVVVWIEGNQNGSFGTYNHSTKMWNVDWYVGFKQESIKYFMYVNNPYL